MAKDERKRQQKIAKQRAKDARKLREASRQKQAMRSLAGAMKLSASGEILGCYLGDSRGSEFNGMTTVLLIRRAPKSMVAYANFLVDRWCLGVKDVTAGIQTSMAMQGMLEQYSARLNMTESSPERGRSIVEGGVAYADSLGLRPHPDYEKARWIWGDVDPSQSAVEEEFGFEGRPTYLAGPYDDDARQRMILQALNDSVGQGNYRLMPPDRVLM